MAEYNPRNRNPRTDGPKTTARWFDDRREDRRNPSNPCGFREPEES